LQEVSIQSPHRLTAEEVVAELETDPDTGLTSGEAHKRRRHYGPNDLGSDQGTQPLRILWEQVANVVVLLLGAAVVVGFAVGEVVEAIAVLVVLVVNTIVGFVTELRSARAMESLRSLLTVQADVERDDRREEIGADGLVPGDIVMIEAGERVPADLRLIETEELYVDEAALTGESEPARKQVDPVDEEVPTPERTSMAYMGTMVASGRGRGVVVAIGHDTEIGEVVELTEQATQTKAPLQEGLDQLGRRLSIGVALGAVVLSGLGILRGREVVEVVEIAIAVAIAVVPEGLPAVATLTLAVGMRRMAEKGALVRRLAAVETLGSATVICSNKTGTLTENRMTATRAETFGEEESEMWASAVLCNDAEIDEEGQVVGDPTEAALLLAAEERGIDWRSLREEHPRRAEVPFSSDEKRMAVVVNEVMHVKGAPEVMIDGDAHPEQREIADELAGKGLRVLAIGRGPTTKPTSPTASRPSK
jgi:P-type Ca2+ transporter type 2C